MPTQRTYEWLLRRKRLLIAGGISTRSRRRDVDRTPILWWCQALRVIYDTNHTWFTYNGKRFLVHREPCDVVDQLLLCLIVLLHARCVVGIDIGLLKQLLCCLLLCSLGRAVL